jgi:hypothetical protein
MIPSGCRANAKKAFRNHVLPHPAVRSHWLEPSSAKRLFILGRPKEGQVFRLLGFLEILKDAFKNGVLLIAYAHDAYARN